MPAAGPIAISTDGDVLIVHPSEETVRFNSLPFRSDLDTAAHEMALDRLIDATPGFPLITSDLQMFCKSISREMQIEVQANLDGTMKKAPVHPRSSIPLRIVDCAACFVAPKTSYFLASDLSTIGARENALSLAETAVGWILSRRSHQPTSNVFRDSRSVVFPFPSNTSQRRVALLSDEQQNKIIVVQGPPGTGKSLTIANVVCHLIARGKKVLVCSQKDKALSVVDQTLRQLELAQLPMTLLRQDADSRKELRDRLDSIQKNRALEDTRRDLDKTTNAHQQFVSGHEQVEQQLHASLRAEHITAQADRELSEAATVLKRVGARWRTYQAHRHAKKLAPVHSDKIGDHAASLRSELLASAVRLLTTAAEHRTGEASRGERNQLREFSKLLGRSQTNAKNFSIFDRLKREPEKCRMLLNVLPCWIMSPDDVARLFPCEPGIFDTVIIDEASQCDLPSMTPVLFRAKQAIIAGDSKQMQAQRFAFTSTQVAAQSWHQHGLDRLDPDRWLDPGKVDLLQLASVRFDEEAFLDEHYRCLPPIIKFSNDRWYGGKLRIMRDDRDRRVGEPESPVVTLTHVTDGHVNPGTQENETEALRLVVALRQKLTHPAYSDATFGVICLFEEQMRLMNDLISDEIEEALRADHDLVVVNPDGFQGDERDVIFYSLSYDANGMEKAALSARQAEREHLQGMLNGAFTRAREEMHIFHSAPVEEFGNAAGKGAILDWLLYCRNHVGTARSTESSFRKAQSEFEADVASELQQKGIRIISQYPSCGFFIDLVAELEDRRLAIECDGEIWHLDEHGSLKAEDVYRQEILERAGWRVIRIPYRSWKKNRLEQISRVVNALSNNENDEEIVADEKTPKETAQVRAVGAIVHLNKFETAIFFAIKEGARDQDETLRAAVRHLGLSRLGSRVRSDLMSAIDNLHHRKIISAEDHELFIIESFLNATVIPTTLQRYARRRVRRRRW